MIKTITKFSAEVNHPNEIGDIMAQCIWHMTNGRMGPVWISVPLNIQSMDTDCKVSWINPPLKYDEYDVIDFKKYKRPVFILGGGSRKYIHDFLEYSQQTNATYVTTFHTVDVPNSSGRVGIYGDRNGNTCVQKADVVISLGCRLAHYFIGYKGIDFFAPNADIYQIDIDETEFHQKRVKYIKCDCGVFISKLPKIKYDTWFLQYEIERNNFNERNPYTILDNFFKLKPSNVNLVCSSGTLQSLIWHTAIPKEGDRFIICTHGDMGYEIPASIGVAMKTNKRTFCFLGDGSFQFTLSELMNLKNLPISVVCFDNNGYGAIKITQRKYFKNNEYGTDFDFPNIKDLANIHSIPYYTEYNEIKDGPCIIHIKCDVQGRYPVVKDILDNFDT